MLTYIYIIHYTIYENILSNQYHLIFTTVKLKSHVSVHQSPPHQHTYEMKKYASGRTTTEDQMGIMIITHENFGNVNSGKSAVPTPKASSALNISNTMLGTSIAPTTTAKAA